MTLHTKAATEDILDIFNQPLRDVDPLVGPPESDGETDYDEDDYTSAGESTGTGRISGTSDFGDTQAELQTGPLASDTAAASVSPWSDFTASKHVPRINDENGKDEDTSNEAGSAFSRPSTQDGTEKSSILDQLDSGGALKMQAESDQAATRLGEEQDMVTPILAEENEENEPPRTRYVPLPPEDYEVPVRTFRDPAVVAQNRLPFMTPIAEKTESSLGGLTNKLDKDYFNSKTPSRNKSSSYVALEINEEVLSSPFCEIINESRPTRFPGLGIIKETAGLEPPQSKRSPAIEDLQCNPVDDSVRTTILANSNPPVSEFVGYFDYRPSCYGKAPEIQKFIKSLSKSKSEGKTSTSLCMPPTICFQSDSSKWYTIRRELGKGAFAPVYLAEEGQDGALDSGKASDRPSTRLLAIKCEHPPTPWEFYIMSALHMRLDSSSIIPMHPSVIPSLCKPTALHLYTDEAYLLETYLDQGTLLDLVNLARSDPRGQSTTLDESIAMFFTVELLRSVEAMHAVGLLHGDLKADNCLVRLSPPSSSSSTTTPIQPQSNSHDNEAPLDQWSSQYSSEGKSGWSHRGLCLIDFGRGIDLCAFRPDVQFIADWKTGKQDCIEMREMRPWTYQVDYWGMAGVAHSLLFGKYLEDNVVIAPSISALDDANDRPLMSPPQATAAGNVDDHQRKRYRPREPFKRYWQTPLWTRLFDLLLNPVLCAAAPVDKGGEPGGQMPCSNGLRAVRRDMEMWLEGEGGKRNGGLRNGLRRLEERVMERKGRGGGC